MLRMVLLQMPLASSLAAPFGVRTQGPEWESAEACYNRMNSEPWRRAMSTTTGDRSRKRSGAAGPQAGLGGRCHPRRDHSAHPGSRHAAEDRTLRLASSRGDAHADSDYDLLLVEPSELPRHRQRAARYRHALTGLAGAKDILVWTPDEVAQ